MWLRSYRHVVGFGLPGSADAVQHGTLAWEESYFRRVGIESFFADLKSNRIAVHRGFLRGFGLRRYTLLMGFTLAALNVLVLRDWFSRREQVDPWGGSSVNRNRCAR